MDNNRPLDNMEEKRDLSSPNQKHTLNNNREKGGLNDGNPNTDRTPASTENTTGSTTQIEKKNSE